MAIRLKEVVTAGLWLMLAAIFYFSFFGCSIKLNDNGSVFMKFGTTIEFGHTTARTDAESIAETNVASEFLRSLGLWKEKGEITDAELLEAIRFLQYGDSVPIAVLLADPDNE